MDDQANRDSGRDDGRHSLPYAGYCFPPEIISHAVWLYFRFLLSLRTVDELLAARGIMASHETVRQWALKFGQAFANQIRRRPSCAGEKWQSDEIVVKIAGVKHWLWRAVDQTGMVLDVLVQSRRDKDSAKRLLRKLLTRQCRAPRVMITDKLASYGAAKREVMPSVEHSKHEGLNTRAENSHQPRGRRKRQMKRFKSAGQAQRFLSARDGINNLFCRRRHQVPATQYRAARGPSLSSLGRHHQRRSGVITNAPYSSNTIAATVQHVDGASVTAFESKRFGSSTCVIPDDESIVGWSYHSGNNPSSVFRRAASSDRSIAPSSAARVAVHFQQDERILQS